MSAFDDLPTLKRKVERLRSEADKAAGACSQLLRRLKEEFGCKSLAEAEALLMELQTQEIETYKQYNRAKKKFERKWQQYL